MQVLYITAAIVFLDQVTKLLVKGFWFPWFHVYHPGMQLGESVMVFGNFLRLTYVENPGMAFGIIFGDKIFLTLFSLAASIGILFYLYKSRKEPFVVRLSLALILGGALGNLIDRMFYGVLFGEERLFYGRVVDFIDMDFIKIHVGNISMTRFAVFNIADASVTCGIILMLIFAKKFSEVNRSHEPVAATTPADGESPVQPPSESH